MNPCNQCNGTGEIVTCWDDLCANSDTCIHGDGYATCPTCKGEGFIPVDEDEDEWDDSHPLGQELHDAILWEKHRA